MKCQFCGAEGLLNPRAKSNEKAIVVYDPHTLNYYEVKPSQYLICPKCGRTETFSSFREMSIMDVGSMAYNL